jgi:hypothetical protein
VRRRGHALVIGAGLLAVAPGSALAVGGILENQFKINLGVPTAANAPSLWLALLAIFVAPLLAIATLLYSGAPRGDHPNSSRANVPLVDQLEERERVE